jgi:SAM-dependent methyltransferase
MMNAPNPKHDFLSALLASLDNGSFVKLVLGKACAGSGLKKCVATPVIVRDKPMLRFVITHERRDVTENRSHGEVWDTVAAMIGETFLSAHLFTTTRDVALDHNKKGEPRLTTAKPTFATVAVADHNRIKAYVVEPSRPYLKALGVALDDGRVKPSMHPKYKQICHFIEVIDDLIRLSPLKDAGTLTVIDIGAGKGYLTFALYDYLTAHLKKQCVMTGIDVRDDVVAFCNDLAGRLKLSGLSFEAAAANKSQTTPIDLVIALHACDTATDDALFQGIKGEAKLIVTAPCCQHELAPQLSKPAMALRAITKFGLFKQRQADLVTDTARCLLLEASGYKVKVIEFVSTEHTAKNLMIAATRDPGVDRAAARHQYNDLKALMNFERQHLATLLSTAGLDDGIGPNTSPAVQRA